MDFTTHNLSVTFLFSGNVEQTWDQYYKTTFAVIELL